MSKQANATIIGLFVLGAIFIAVLGITIFSSGKWFIDKEAFIIYFDEPVNGLSIGAAVKVQGVAIGKVTDIQLEIDPQSRQMLTPVFIEIEPDKIANIMRLSQFKNEAEFIQQLVKDGWRMQLKFTSLVTGQLYIDSLFSPAAPIRLTGLHPEITELPSVVSSGQELQTAINDFVRDYRNIPVQELFSEILQVAQNIEQLTRSDDMHSSMQALSQSLTQLQQILSKINRESDTFISDLQQTVSNTRQLMQTLNEQSDPLLQQMATTLDSTVTSVQQFQAASASVENIFNEDAAVYDNFKDALLEFTRAARSLRILSDYLQQHPEAIIKGKGSN